ncbi:MAG: 4a-hydroxytetrahydrobiopterin dehydratase [Nitrospinaceae bacterium]|nr:4a-hydroxytetrahydrobiopterin dehydratase [Nitrospinaceae bacterium]NIR56378.1 4a-hydroxytetrahydrobiopterin dehydratase [Nitrospinaceae bacterium]NIS86840.1 4a-hydroxytetrahydrobiopterin dehydratase [Nitrospinaceae bacterium]NIT83676.1 4a-hydroxytetrahydrobiopterin dehydratase [Nitrospinaceae bacterium]NIU45874.1 4a-hydroxytetrahydrobiopterin dehydratase [Nitrospinaceae bacterium]
MVDVLTKKKCAPCEGGVEPLKGDAVQEYLQQLNRSWEVVDDYMIRCGFTFKNFKEAMAFADRVGEIAESEGHHPDLHVSYGKVTVDLTTHAINGLSENDFILAAKVETLL